MTTIPGDPVAPAGIGKFGQRLRAGEITAEAATRAYLARIEALDPRLGAFEFVAVDQALAAARAADLLLAAGTDLGPLMGVPVAVKDIFAVDGMPTLAGSKVEVGDLIGDEGGFVKTLKRAGCIILGKAKTVEFALGAVGTNQVRGTPWNPWDAKTHHAPGGSSSGSAVAVAAGLCAFAIGTDTGGSVRMPAAFCGVFGLKTTVGLWPTDGVFPLSTSLDSIGLLCSSAADAALTFAALTGRSVPRVRDPAGLRLGKVDYFFRNLEPEVDACTAAALDALASAGAKIIAVTVPEAAEREAFFPQVPADLIAGLGRERFLQGREKMDPVVAARAARGLEVKAAEYIQLIRRQRQLVAIIEDRMAGLDAWIGPTALMLPMPVASLDDELRLAATITQNTQLGNLFDLCGTSSPIQGAALPVGLQVLCRRCQDAAALSIGLAIEALLGVPPRPDLTPFA